MCRLLGWVSRTPRTLADVLGPGGLPAFRELSRHHADGWGLAVGASAAPGAADPDPGTDPGTAAGDPDPVVRRSTDCAALDPAFEEAAHLAGTAGIAHLRWATPGLAVEARNTHPFARAGTVFAHNGALHPQTALATALPLAPPREPLGSTDSERCFLTLLSALDAGADLPGAVAHLLRAVAGLATTSLNCLLLTPTTLAVLNAHDPAAAPAELPGSGRDAAVEAVELAAPYFDLRYRVGPQEVVVASSGFAQPDGQGWTALPNGTLLTVDRATLAVEVVPVLAPLPSGGPGRAVSSG